MQRSNILILGGGTAGLSAALILKTRFPNKEISVVKSDKIGVIGVGEGSTEHWRYFMEFCGLDWREVIKETDAAIKVGIKYVNWTDEDYYYNVDERFYSNTYVGQFLGAYIQSYAHNKPQIVTTYDLGLSSKVPNQPEVCSNQFHFNALKLRDYLEKKCTEKNIKVYTDEIDNVITNEFGIDYISGNQQYKSDFYIDSTGFKRVLINKLGAKWISYKKYLKMNEAIAFPTSDTPEYPVYTTITAMKYGWMWQTPVYGRWGNGYVFDNNYINARQAQDEVEEHLGHSVKLFKNIKFEPGGLEKVWIKNCMALGLSANFIEPLEATSIGSTINQTFMFMNYYTNYDQTQIDQFNDKMKLVMENLRDFVCLHYLVKKDNSNFWKDLQSVELPDTLKHNLELWKNRPPIADDFPATRYLLFFENNFTSILYGLKLLNYDKIKNIYESFSEQNKTNITYWVNEYNKEINFQKNNSMSHKEWLNYVRQ